MNIHGFQVFAAPEMSTRAQIRFPRSKKSRIRKKWRRDNRNWVSEPDRTVYQMGNKVFMHPVMIEELRQHVLPSA